MRAEYEISEHKGRGVLRVKATLEEGEKFSLNKFISQNIEGIKKNIINVLDNEKLKVGCDHASSSSEKKPNKRYATYEIAACINIVKQKFNKFEDFVAFTFLKVWLDHSLQLVLTSDSILSAYKEDIAVKCNKKRAEVSKRLKSCGEACSSYRHVERRGAIFSGLLASAPAEVTFAATTRSKGGGSHESRYQECSSSDSGASRAPGCG